MKTNLLEQLKKGKKIRVKHPQYEFVIHAEARIEEGDTEPSVFIEKINLPQKAKKGEKYLLKLAHIYCFDVMCNNLLNDVLNSQEYLKLIRNFRNDNAAVNPANYGFQRRRQR